jgi:hypothetical protein
VTARAERARSFATAYREQLVTRASKRAVRKFGRALTDSEARAIRIAVLTFVPKPKRCECGKRAVAGDTLCHRCRSDWTVRG